MKREQREEEIGEWRRLLRPLLDEKKATQEQVVQVLSAYGTEVDQSTVSRWLKDTTPQPAVMPAIRGMLTELRAGMWPPSVADARREAAPDDDDHLSILELRRMMREDGETAKIRAEAARYDARAADRRAAAGMMAEAAALLRSGLLTLESEEGSYQDIVRWVSSFFEGGPPPAPASPEGQTVRPPDA